MILRKWVLPLTGLAMLGVIGFAASRAVQAERTEQSSAPVPAAALENPGVVDNAPVNLNMDFSKGTIETPTKGMLAKNSAVSPKADNPKVAPGRVKWHPTFLAACDAARKSKKPVLLFQMMGKLDDQFC